MHFKEQSTETAISKHKWVSKGFSTWLSGLTLRRQAVCPSADTDCYSWGMGTVIGSKASPENQPFPPSACWGGKEKLLSQSRLIPQTQKSINSWAVLLFLMQSSVTLVGGIYCKIHREHNSFLNSETAEMSKREQPNDFNKLVFMSTKGQSFFFKYSFYRVNCARSMTITTDKVEA